jgi:ribulose-bisphosphate carboxylase large chain
MADDTRFRVRYRLRADTPAGGRPARHSASRSNRRSKSPATSCLTVTSATRSSARSRPSTHAGGNAYEADISYSPDSAGDEVIQLINVIFGNSSIQQNIRVVGFEPGRVIRERFAGPRFGIEGVRARTGRSRGGLDIACDQAAGIERFQLADIAYRVARLAAPTSSRTTMASPTRQWPRSASV